MAGIGDLVGADGFGEGDDKAEEVGGGGGVVEAAEVVGGVDAFGWWGMEVVRGGESGDFLGFGDRGENYGLLRGEVVVDDGGRADGAVGGGEGRCRSGMVVRVGRWWGRRS